MAVTPVSNLRLCQPFFKAKHGNLTLTIVEAEKVSLGFRFSFFVVKDGVDSANQGAVASLERIREDVLHLPLMALDPTNSRPVDCVVSTVGWGEWTIVARLECPMEHDNPAEQVTLLLQDTSIRLDLCKDPPPWRKEDVSLSICVRSFSSTVHGTDTVAVTPEHVTRWLDHHVKLGFERFYLYERKKGELSAILEPYMEASPSVRDVVKVMYVPRIGDSDKTFDDLGTKSYVYDQLLVMQSCFARARVEKFACVLHIDYDEYLHMRNDGLTMRHAFLNDTQRCPSAVSLRRCNIPRVKFDVPIAPPDAVCTDANDDLKSAFNATYMARPNMVHNAHRVSQDTRCDSEVLLIHHLPDAYTDRWSEGNLLPFFTRHENRHQQVSSFGSSPLPSGTSLAFESQARGSD